jgi:hypothetical protein
LCQSPLGGVNRRFRTDRQMRKGRLYSNHLHDLYPTITSEIKPCRNAPGFKLVGLTDSGSERAFSLGAPSPSVGFMCFLDFFWRWSEPKRLKKMFEARVPPFVQLNGVER